MGDGNDWQSEFRALFESPSMEDWDRAFELKTPKLPENVFKYRALTAGETRTNNLDALKHNYVWAPQAKYLNDPFDCTMSFELSSSFLEGQKLKVREGSFNALPSAATERLLACSTFSEFVGVVAEHVPTEQLPADKRVKFVEVFIASCMREQDELRQASRDVHQVLTKVCSFSTNGRSPALWAY